MASGRNKTFLLKGNPGAGGPEPDGAVRKMLSPHRILRAPSWIPPSYAFLRPRAAFTFSLFVPMLTVINSIKNRKYDAVRSSRPLRFDLTGTAVGQCVPVSVRGIGALNSTAARLSASTHDGHSPIAAPYGFPCGLFLCAAPRVYAFSKGKRSRHPPHAGGGTPNRSKGVPYARRRRRCRLGSRQSRHP